MNLYFRWVRILVFKILLTSSSLLSKKNRRLTTEGHGTDRDIHHDELSLLNRGQIPCVSVGPKDGYKRLTIFLLVRQLQSVSTRCNSTGCLISPGLYLSMENSVYAWPLMFNKARKVASNQHGVFYSQPAFSVRT